MKLSRESKMKLAIAKGYTANTETGVITNIKGKQITGTSLGYIHFCVDKKYGIKGSHFVWYCKYGTCPEKIDHINRNRADDRIENLRPCTDAENHQNKNCKGYSYSKVNQKYVANICFDYKNYYLGLYDNEEDARNSYLSAKKVYHLFNPEFKYA